MSPFGFAKQPVCFPLPLSEFSFELHHLLASFAPVTFVLMRTAIHKPRP
jgi:hypothetical protein